jgi:cysteine desulfurase/selenocysteine lyase
VVGERATVGAWREGGTGGDSSNPFQPEELPYRLEGGTPNVFGIAGLREGVRWVLARGPETIAAHERTLLQAFLAAIGDTGRFEWYGADRVISGNEGAGRVGLVAFNLPGMTSAELAAELDTRHGVAVRAGLHCAPYAHRHLGTFPHGAARVSVGALTTEAEVRHAASALAGIARQ